MKDIVIHNCLEFLTNQQNQRFSVVAFKLLKINILKMLNLVRYCEVRGCVFNLKFNFIKTYYIIVSNLLLDHKKIYLVINSA